MARLCVATTLREPEDLLEPFLAYHRELGFARFFLFFDDPGDQSFEAAARHDDVTAIRSTPEFREAQLTCARDLQAEEVASALGEYPNLTSPGLIDSPGQQGLFVRQQMNLASAIGVALEDEYEWLISIDIDELFVSESQAAEDHFSALSDDGVELSIYLNHECVPEASDINYPFDEVDVFKLNRRCLEASQLSNILDISSTGRHFRAYENGKSAVRLAPKVIPRGSHRFAIPGRALTAKLHCDPCILHYSECGFQRFEQKYRMLGDFPDQFFHRLPVEIDWLRRSRDLWRRGDRESARTVYESEVVAAPGEVERGLRAGLYRRFRQPRSILARIAQPDGPPRRS